jgi:hypothetical protein
VHRLVEQIPREPGESPDDYADRVAATVREYALRYAQAGDLDLDETTEDTKPPMASPALDQLISFTDNLPDRLLDGGSLRAEMYEMTNLFLGRVSQDGTILMSEGGALSLMGLQPGEVVGRNINEWAGSTIADAMRRTLDRGTHTTVVESPLFGGYWVGTYNLVKNGAAYCNASLLRLPEDFGCVHCPFRGGPK